MLFRERSPIGRSIVRSIDRRERLCEIGSFFFAASRPQDVKLLSRITNYGNDESFFYRYRSAFYEFAVDYRGVNLSPFFYSRKEFMARGMTIGGSVLTGSSSSDIGSRTR